MFFVIFDLGMALLLLILGLCFYKSKGKASNFLTGYNSKSTNEIEGFDDEKMCKDYGKRMTIWAIPFLIGTIVDIFKSGVGCALAWIGYIILFIWHMVDRVKNEKSRYMR
ncbi:protein of unknown function [Clostridium cavendishii DSM 21758]|uniref:DUF3784 domain-containing protein n=1 Tax=Clostridium cavendishii DSM 21758 TaxID=1121302 RepID=A0A1M6GER7_9CLOT|nr:DUF3784 domain-containing protein [Clostridium cavendishii]SHJ08445.1 protein of unknown function [Clostridium cavendishii DSM 21758]